MAESGAYIDGGERLRHLEAPLYYLYPLLSLYPDLATEEA